MSFSIILIFILALLSGIMVLLSNVKFLKEWPKVPSVALISNISILVLYYSPLHGHLYYLINIIKIIPFILLLVYFASKDPAPSWSYRAMCWVFIGQIGIYGIHIMTDLNFVYYDQSNLAVTLLEFFVVMCGGFNVRTSFMGENFNNNNSSTNSNTWARSHIKN